MSHLVLVAVGAAAGSVLFVVAWQRGWQWRRVLAANTIVAALDGAVAGALVFRSSESMVLSLLGYGLFGTAAPFASTLLTSSPLRDASDAWREIRRTGVVLSVNALFCATAASAAYILVAGGFIYAYGTAVGG